MWTCRYRDAAVASWRRSPWRALFRQIGGEFIVAAIGPEAQSNPRRFAAACRRAEARLAEIEDAI